MYIGVKLINSLIREEFISSPFGFISNNVFVVKIFEVLIGGCIVHVISYGMCGMIYEKNSNPVVGSMLYMLFFIINTAVISILGKLCRDIAMVIIVYSVFVFAVLFILSKIKDAIFF